MRKFLVVLLILSVMGGAFAQENKWGAISGSAELNTTLDFAAKTNIEETTIVGGMSGELNVEWAKKWDNGKLGEWSITLPLKAANDYFGTGGDAATTEKTGANITYVLGDLTVKVPFWFKVDADTNSKASVDKDGITNKDGSEGSTTLFGIPLFWDGNADVNAEWAGDLWGFKVGVANLYTNPAVAYAGGYFKFMNGRSQLYVSRDSYGRGDFPVYETNWWSVSDYVKNPSMKNHSAAGIYLAGDEYISDHEKMAQYSFHWENINDNGIAYRFYLIPDVLNLGLAFVSSGKGDPNSENESNDNSGPFYEDSIKPDNLLVQDFLRHPVFGVSYDNTTLGVSAMVGLEPWDSNPKMTDVYIHLGGKFQLLESLKINGDISARFSTGEMLTGAGDAPKPNFNFGVEVSYTSDIIFAGLGFKMLDLINKDITMFGTDLVVGFGGAHRDNYSYADFGSGDTGDGPIIALKGHVNGYLPSNDAGLFAGIVTEGANDNIFNIGLNLLAGWKNFVLIAAPSGGKAPELKLSVGADLGLDFWFGPGEEGKVPAGNHMLASFNVYPSIDWQVWNNGKISFAYKLGSSDITRAKDRKGTTLDTNEFKTTFKWEF